MPAPSSTVCHHVHTIHWVWDDHVPAVPDLLRGEDSSRSAVTYGKERVGCNAMAAGRAGAPYVVDAVIAAVLYALMLTTPARAPQGAASLPAAYVVAGAVVCGALAFRRRWPLWVLWVTVAGALVHTVLERSGAAGTPFLVASSLAVFTFVLASGRSAGLAGGAITALVLFCADGL